MMIFGYSECDGLQDITKANTNQRAPTDITQKWGKDGSEETTLPQLQNS
jgi:hypothetical protein